MMAPVQRLRLTLTILSLYAFLIQGLLGAAYSSVSGVPALCQGQTTPGSPTEPRKHAADESCCSQACRLVAIAAPPASPEPARLARIAKPGRPRGETSEAVAMPPSPQARGPPNPV
ncbi:MAG: hypothetical protein P4L76_01810 [Beijerinckiaceae bacterium]|nr:hypothetical protein [Beijerinckiaceae bacterium]